MEQTKITVLISSCDAYSLLWDDFEKFLKNIGTSIVMLF